MSVGNLKDQGNKGNNLPYQLRSLQLLGEISTNTSIGGSGSSYGYRSAVYQAIAAGVGYSIGDIIIRYDVIDIATSTVSATIWFNQTTQTTIPAPLPADITPVSPPSSVTIINGVGGAAVNIQDGGNSITIDGAVTVSNTLATYPLPASPVSGYAGPIINTTATDIIAAPGVGLTTYITQILVTNASATVGTVVTIRDEDGTAIYSGYAAPAGGGFSISFPTPLKMPVANKKLQAVCGTTGSSVYVSANGFKI